MEKFNEKVIIGRIKQLRNQYTGNRGKSKFARALGISPSTYSYYETNRVPPIDVLLKICEITGADLEWLFTGGSAKKSSAFAPNSQLLENIDTLLKNNPELAEPISAFIELLREKKDLKKNFIPKPARPGPAGYLFSAGPPPA